MLFLAKMSEFSLLFFSFFFFNPTFLWNKTKLQVTKAIRQIWQRIFQCDVTIFSNVIIQSLKLYHEIGTVAVKHLRKVKIENSELSLH